MDRLVRWVFSKVVARGTLTVSTRPGRSFTVGDGTGVPIAIAASYLTLIKIFLDPELRLGEAYMDGDFRLERGSILQFLDLALSQGESLPPLPGAVVLAKLRFLLRRIAQFNLLGRSKRNVAHHYDLNGKLFSLFLDADRQYSCAYFERRQDAVPLTRDYISAAEARLRTAEAAVISRDAPLS